MPRAVRSAIRDTCRPFRANTAIRRNAANGAMRPGSPMFARLAPVSRIARQAHVDAMLCIEHDYFAEAQSGAGEYGLS
jgi:hypothetical protein